MLSLTGADTVLCVLLLCIYRALKQSWRALWSQQLPVPKPLSRRLVGTGCRIHPTMFYVECPLLADRFFYFVFAGKEFIPRSLSVPTQSCGSCGGVWCPASPVRACCTTRPCGGTCVVGPNRASPGQVCCRQKDYWQFVKDIRRLSPSSAHHLEKVSPGGCLCVPSGREESSRAAGLPAGIALPWPAAGEKGTKQPRGCVQATSRERGVI